MQGEELDKGIDHTFPHNIVELEEYMPISCCNVLHKIITTVIANRLNVHMPELIYLKEGEYKMGF